MNSTLARDLLESDAVYFEAGASLEDVGGATLVHIDGLADLAAGCVIQRIDPSNIPSDLDRWLDGVEQRLLALGCPLARIYLQDTAPELERALKSRGYAARDELGMVRLASRAVSAEIVDAADEISIAPVGGESDWSAKYDLHAECALGPDGHEAPAEKWVEMERRKCDAGYMKPYLIVNGDEVRGALSVADCGELLRLKNLVIHPDHRRTGIGRRAAALVGDLATKSGKRAAGCFVHDDAPWVSIYESAGYEIATRQTEWAKALT